MKGTIFSLSVLHYAQRYYTFAAMKLAENFVPLLPLTPTGSMTLKADHPRRVWELDETYHTASPHRFEEQHGSKS